MYKRQALAAAAASRAADQRRRRVRHNALCALVHEWARVSLRASLVRGDTPLCAIPDALLSSRLLARRADGGDARGAVAGAASELRANLCAKSRRPDVVALVPLRAASRAHSDTGGSGGGLAPSSPALSGLAQSGPAQSGPALSGPSQSSAQASPLRAGTVVAEVEVEAEAEAEAPCCAELLIFEITVCRDDALADRTAAKAGKYADARAALAAALSRLGVRVPPPIVVSVGERSGACAPELRAALARAATASACAEPEVAVGSLLAQLSDAARAW